MTNRPIPSHAPPAYSFDTVLAYVREHARNGQFTGSLKEISEATGIKASTVARALKKLEGDEILRALPKERHNDPTTFQLISEVAQVDISELKDALQKLSKGIDLAGSYIRRLQMELDNARKAAELVSGEIIKVDEVPGSNIRVIYVKIDR